MFFYGIVKIFKDLYRNIQVVLEFILFIVPPKRRLQNSIHIFFMNPVGLNCYATSIEVDFQYRLDFLLRFLLLYIRHSISLNSIENVKHFVRKLRR